MVTALRRVADLAAVGVGSLNVPTAPPRRLLGLATHGMAGKTTLLRRMSREHRLAVLVATVLALSARAIDEALELFDLVMTTQLVSRVERESRDEKLRRHPRVSRNAGKLAVAVRVLAGGDLDGAALQDGQCPLAYPRLGVGVAFGEEAPGRAPHVFQDVDQVDDDGDVDPSGAGFGLDAVDLVVVAVDQCDPVAPMVRVASFGFVEDAGDDLGGVVDHAGGQPLVLGFRCRRRGVLAAFAGEHVGGLAGHGLQVVDGADLSHYAARAIMRPGSRKALSQGDFVLRFAALSHHNWSRKARMRSGGW